MSGSPEANGIPEGSPFDELAPSENIYMRISRLALAGCDPTDYPEIAHELSLMKKYQAWVAEYDTSPSGRADMPKTGSSALDGEFFGFACHMAIVETTEPGDELPHRPTMMERYRAWVAECNASPDGWVDMPKGVTGSTDSVFSAFVMHMIASDTDEPEPLAFKSKRRT